MRYVPDMFARHISSLPQPTCFTRSCHTLLRARSVQLTAPAVSLSVGPVRQAGTLPRMRMQCASTAASATDKETPVLERLEGGDAEQWQAAVTEAQKVGWSSEEAAQLLERAFGWRTQTFWRGMKKEEIPDPSQIAASISFLSTELGLKDTEIQAAVKRFPEGLASGVEDRLKPNMQILEKQFYMPKKNLGAAVKRQPKALGFSYDCEGSCEGECHRCWVRF